MANLVEMQLEAAKKLVNRLGNAKRGAPVLAHVSGAVGAGKSTILRHVAAELPSIGKFPLVIDSVAGELDSGPMALLSAVDQLERAKFETTDWSILDDPTRRWSTKLAVVTDVIERHSDSLVLICDEPARWYHPARSLVDDTPEECARQFAEWIARDARCQRVVSGFIPAGALPTMSPTRVPRIDDAREYLSDSQSWNGLSSRAKQLRDAVAWPLEGRSVWEVRLCVALTLFIPVQEIVSLAVGNTSADVLAVKLLDHLETDPSRKRLCEALARLAVSRDLLDRDVVRTLLDGTPDIERAVVEDVLMEWDMRCGRLHPLVRQEIVNRARDPRRIASKACWRLRTQDRRDVHRQLAANYREFKAKNRRGDLEAFHHQCLSGELSDPRADARLRFIEQLHEVGRSLSYVFHEHDRAAEYFRLAVSLDDARAYSHHYLAFNLDWLASETQTIERSYLRAIELQPTHPWWWSRWISYLATRGEYRRAREEWQRARDELSISESTSDWVFLSLHRWVARWLLHWGQLDFAQEVLQEIPQELAQRDLSIRTLQDLLVALRHAKRGICVFPLTVPASEWRSPAPHTDLPPTVGNDSLVQWFPGRVESIDYELGEASITVGYWPTSSTDDFHVEDKVLTRDEINFAADGFSWADLAAGRFVELGYYGPSRRMRIGLHRETEWRDPNLLPLVPPAARWFDRAVSEAWNSLEGRNS